MNYKKVIEEIGVLLQQLNNQETSINATHNITKGLCDIEKYIDSLEVYKPKEVKKDIDKKEWTDITKWHDSSSNTLYLDIMTYDTSIFTIPNWRLTADLIKKYKITHFRMSEYTVPTNKTYMFFINVKGLFTTEARYLDLRYMDNHIETLPTHMICWAGPQNKTELIQKYQESSYNGPEL